MRIDFLNYWKGSSMKKGGTFPITFFEIFIELNAAFRYFEFTILNFGISIQR